MKMRGWLLIKILLLATMGCVRLFADVAFDNFSANVLLKTTNAQVKIVNRANILGFSGESIVKDFGHNSPSNWVEAYTNNDRIGMSGGTKVVSTDLVTSNSFSNAYLPSAVSGPGAGTGSVDGRIYPRFQTTLHYFPSGTSTVQGFVYLGGGFTIDPQGIAVMDTVQTVSGPISLGDTGKMVLSNDVYFTHAVVLTSGGYIQGKRSLGGQGNTLFLNGDLTLSSATGTPIVHITGDWNTVGASSGDLIIDGQGHTLSIQDRAQIFVDQNVTLTLRNMTIRTGPKSINNSPIQLASFGSKLALDNVIFDLGADFHFPQGQIFIHDDVAMTGTSAFVYQSPVPSYITSGATWSFETGTTFSIAPATYTDQPFTAGTATSNNFIVLADQSAALSLNNCSLKTTFTGARFTKGMVLLNDKVAIDTQAAVDLNSSTPLGTGVGAVDFSTTVSGAAVSPDGRYVAVVGLDNVMGTNGALGIYRFNGAAALTRITYAAFGTSVLPAVAWSPDGRFVAAGGDAGMRIYRFNGSTLTTVLTQSFGLFVNSISWSPDGRYLAVGGNNGTTPLIVYRFDGTTLTQVATMNPNSNSIQVNNVTWSPDGRFLMVSGRNSGPVGGSFIYLFNGRTLSLVEDLYPGENSFVAAWSPDGRLLARCFVTAGSGRIYIYSFDGTSSTFKINISVSIPSFIYATAWSPDGRYFMVCGYNGSGRYSLFRVNLSGTTELLGFPTFGTTATTVAWSPDSKYVLVGGTNTGVGQNLDLVVFPTIMAATAANTQGFTNGLLFGDKAKGVTYDANVQVLGGSAVTVKGMVSDDSM